MSQALRIAVVSRLEADAPLVALLAADPDAPASPALFAGGKNQAPPVYDCLTFRLEQATPDARFRPAAPGAYAEGIEDFYLDCEAWTLAPDSAPLDAINARLDALFHFQAFDAAGGRVFFCERVLRQSDLYDKTLNCWFSLSRYRLRFQQAAP